MNKENRSSKLWSLIVVVNNYTQIFPRFPHHGHQIT